jgi:hypothetical protein
MLILPATSLIGVSSGSWTSGVGDGFVGDRHRSRFHKRPR